MCARETEKRDCDRCTIGISDMMNWDNLTQMQKNNQFISKRCTRLCFAVMISADDLRHTQIELNYVNETQI